MYQHMKLISLVKQLCQEYDSTLTDCQRLRQDNLLYRQDQDKLVSDLQQRLTLQEREIHELFGRLSKSELDQAFEQKLHRDLMMAQSSFEQAMKRVKALEEDLKLIHQACLKGAQEKGIEYSKDSLRPQIISIIDKAFTMITNKKQDESKANIKYKEFVELKKEIDQIKTQIKRDGSSSNEREKTIQASVLEQILKNVQDLKSSSSSGLTSPSDQIQTKKPSGQNLFYSEVAALNQKRKEKANPQEVKKKDFNRYLLQGGTKSASEFSEISSQRPQTAAYDSLKGGKYDTRQTAGQTLSNQNDEMSFNRRGEASQTTNDEGKENIESMISRVQQENQVFSSRVLNLKSRIDLAYQQFQKNGQKQGGGINVLSQTQKPLKRTGMNSPTASQVPLLVNKHLENSSQPRSKAMHLKLGSTLNSRQPHLKSDSKLQSTRDNIVVKDYAKVIGTTSQQQHHTSIPSLKQTLPKHSQQFIQQHEIVDTIKYKDDPRIKTVKRASNNRIQKEIPQLASESENDEEDAIEYEQEESSPDKGEYIANEEDSKEVLISELSNHFHKKKAVLSNGGDYQQEQHPSQQSQSPENIDSYLDEESSQNEMIVYAVSGASSQTLKRQSDQRGGQRLSNIPNQYEKRQGSAYVNPYSRQR
ncbi:hypothetical protein FGO68_gene5692 [Halteria grandinella]|uniref:Uncharacterized protein n=1 Tax=Halteria grandinella TaxID=5974 RepID=A0A8J8NEA8_HALGN|nr:hypothetical protein FGO68_gene5692 [Halteria grandinella]